MNPARTEYVTRDSILKLLTASELAAVSTAEAGPRLSSGDEYLDLAHLDLGVRHATGTVAPMTTLLAKKTVSEATWTKIVDQLVTPLAQ